MRELFSGILSQRIAKRVNKKPRIIFTNGSITFRIVLDT